MPRKTLHPPDKILLAAFVVLLVVGTVALFSASVNASQEDYGNLYGYFLHQVFYGLLVGTVAAVGMYLFPYRHLKRLALPVFLGALFLMMLVFVPGISREAAGAQRWIDVGFFVLQPSELAKFALIIYLAAWLETHKARLKDFSALVPFSVLLGLMAALLILQPNFSTLMLTAVIAGAMYFAAGAPWKYVGGLIAAGVLFAAAMIQIAPYRLRRLTTFFNPSEDPLGVSFQINQALIAIGSGRIWGKGLAQGLEHKRLLPEQMNDSIFAVWAQETGFLGATFLIGLFGVILVRGFRAATQAKDMFASLAALGITIWLVTQALFNMGAMMGLVPLTGIPLPFVSYGSSSLVVSMAAMGLLLQLSRKAT
ncbi:MAG: putative lipid II flippase FtsW [Candidatus Spechtbacterales bacterium]